MPREPLVLRWGPIPGTAQESFFDDDTPDGTLLFTGGWASGKTMSLTAKMLKLSAINAPLPGIWCVPDYGHIQRTILPTLTDADPDTGDPWFLRPDQFEYRAQDSKHGPGHSILWEGGGPIWFVTAENHKSIAGPNVAFCGTDEPGSIRPEAWRNTVARVRHPGARLRQKVAAGTPEGLNFLSEQFGPDMAEGFHKYVMPTTENTELLRHNPGYLDQVRANATETELAAYLEGKFVNMTGSLAYPMFNAERQMRELTIDPLLPLRLSFDFNVNPMTVTIGQQWPGPYGPEFGVLHAVALSDSTTMAACEAVRRLYPIWAAGVVIYGDATAKRRDTRDLRSNYTIIENLLSPMGPLQFKVGQQNPPVATRINTVNLLCKDAKGITRLWLHGDPQRPRTSPCRELVRSLQQSTKKTGTDDLSKPTGETITHMSDAVGYWLTCEAPAVKPTLSVAVTKAPHGLPAMSGTMAALKAGKSARLAKELGRGV